MKEMIYSHERKTDILLEGTYKGYNFYIISYEVHPCAYIELPENHPYYDKDYDDMKILVHGGLTYKGNLPSIIGKSNRVFIGWDYAHVGDYLGFTALFHMSDDEKKWTTKEIFEDVKWVINQLSTHEGENK